jgi:hypothetical protein
MSEFLWFVGICVAVALISAAILHRLRPAWSLPRTAMLSALPIPAVTTILCAAVFLTAAFSSDEACGVDACGMAMMAAMGVIGYAIVGYLGGAIACVLLLRLLAKP